MQTPSSVEAAIESRKNNFDFLRFLFASLVLTYHSYPLLMGQSIAMTSIPERIAEFTGGSAVDGFFIISGYLVTSSWEHSPIALRFSRKRILRIFPGFIMASLFCALVVGPLASANIHAYFHSFHPLGFFAYAISLAGPYMPPIFANLPFPGAVDGSFWTLRYEFECYIFVLLFGLAIGYKRRLAILALFVVSALAYLVQISGLAVLVHSHVYKLIGDPSLWLRLATCYLAGMVGYLYRDKIVYTRIAAIIAAFAILILCAINDNIGHGVFPILGAYVILAFAFDQGIPLTNWARYGDFSYGMYLYAFPVQQLLIMYLSRNHLTPTLLSLAAFPCVLLLAFLSWHFTESPSLGLKRTVVAKQPSST